MTLNEVKNYSSRNKKKFQVTLSYQHLMLLRPHTQYMEEQSSLHLQLCRGKKRKNSVAFFYHNKTFQEMFENVS